MRTILAATLLIAATAGAAPARAADLGHYYTAPAPLSAFSWAGPYLGANIGYEWGSVTNSSAQPSGIAGGLQAGYNWQFGQFVVGAETDIQASAANDTFAPWQFSNPWFGTVRGRAGVTIGNTLIFGTAGFAYGSLTVDSAGNLSETRTSFGFAAGLGAEVGFTPHWSAKAEWLYLDLSDRTFSVTGTTNGLTANLIRLGVNYHF